MSLIHRSRRFACLAALTATALTAVAATPALATPATTKPRYVVGAQGDKPAVTFKDKASFSAYVLRHFGVDLTRKPRSLTHPTAKASWAGDYATFYWDYNGGGNHFDVASGTGQPNLVVGELRPVLVHELRRPDLRGLHARRARDPLHGDQLPRQLLPRAGQHQGEPPVRVQRHHLVGLRVLVLNGTHAGAGRSRSVPVLRVTRIGRLLIRSASPTTGGLAWDPRHCLRATADGDAGSAAPSLTRVGEGKTDLDGTAPEPPKRLMAAESKVAERCRWGRPRAKCPSSREDVKGSPVSESRPIAPIVAPVPDRTGTARAPVSGGYCDVRALDRVVGGEDHLGDGVGLRDHDHVRAHDLRDSRLRFRHPLVRRRSSKPRASTTSRRLTRPWPHSSPRTRIAARGIGPRRSSRLTNLSHPSLRRRPVAHCGSGAWPPPSALWNAPRSSQRTRRRAATGYSVRVRSRSNWVAGTS